MRAPQLVDRKGAHMTHFPDSIGNGFTIQDRNAVQPGFIAIARKRKRRYLLCLRRER
jgi:hypothetical protein